MSFRHTPYHMLLEALSGQGCPICAVVDEEVVRFLDQLLHENVNDLEFRDHLRSALGFCPTHAWWLAGRFHGAALGATIMYRDVVHAARQRIESIARSGGSLTSQSRRQALFGRLADGGNRETTIHADCPACKVRTRVEGAFVSTLLDHSRDDRFLEQYAESPGVCLIHLDQAIHASRPVSACKRLLETHMGIMDRLLIELDEFQRKADYRFQDEIIGAEGDAWKRALSLVDGKEATR